MALVPRWLLLAALLCLAAGGTAHAQDDVEDTSDDSFDIVEKAFLLVRHKIDTVDLVLGKNTSVLVEIYNAGNSAASDVILEGAQWPQTEFETSGGVTSGRWEKLAPGATVRAEYFVTPKSSGPYPALAAKVLYKAETGSKPQVAFGATPVLYILSPTQKLLRTALSVGSYASLGMVRTPEQWIWAGSLLGGGAALAGAYWLYTVSTDASKRKQYNRAYDEVSKYQ